MIKRKLSKTSEFKKVFSEGRRIEGKNLIIFILKNDYDFNRMGIIVKKETGKAVVRNKIKRRLKEAGRLLNKKLLPGYDIIVMAKNNIGESNHFEICYDLESLFIKGNCFYKKEAVSRRFKPI
ncbi:MAG: ribonuclease P protein component [Atribacterota bacterium]